MPDNAVRAGHKKLPTSSGCTLDAKDVMPCYEGMYNRLGHGGGCPKCQISNNKISVEKVKKSKLNNRCRRHVNRSKVGKRKVQKKVEM
jgi:hypothetical protein